MYGKDYVYAESRLVNSIVRIEKTGEPIFVEHVSMDNGMVGGVLLKDKTAIRVALDSLNLKPVPLGWCNLNIGATYLARIPRRQDWRQGLRMQTCFSSVIRFDRIPYSNLAACIRGEYPTLKSILAKPVRAVTAWSRKWATNGREVYFGNLGAVGEIGPNKIPALNPEFAYLKESLEASLS